MINTVYKITAPSGKYYIGSTNNLSRRFHQHCSSGYNEKTHGSSYLRKAAAKYGKENLTITIIGEYKTRKEAYTKEQELLNKHFDDVLCMNHKKEACGMSSEDAKKARAKVKNIFDIASYMEENAEARDKQAKNIKQHYIDNPEARFKTAVKRRGFRYIEVFSPEGISLGRFNTATEIKKAFSQFKSVGNISSCLNGKLNHYKKHTFKYTD